MQDFKEKDKLYVENTYARFNLTVTHGKGSYLYDEKGKKYIDLIFLKQSKRRGKTFLLVDFLQVLLSFSGVWFCSWFHLHLLALNSVPGSTWQTLNKGNQYH